VRVDLSPPSLSRFPYSSWKLKEIPDGADHEPGKEPVQHVDALQFSQLKTDLDF
jgi:hypothetical protein